MHVGVAGEFDVVARSEERERRRVHYAEPRQLERLEQDLHDPLAVRVRVARRLDHEHDRHVSQQASAAAAIVSSWGRHTDAGPQPLSDSFSPLTAVLYSLINVRFFDAEKFPFYMTTLLYRIAPKGTTPKGASIF